MNSDFLSFSLLTPKSDNLIAGLEVGQGMDHSGPLFFCSPSSLIFIILGKMENGIFQIMDTA